MPTILATLPPLHLLLLLLLLHPALAFTDTPPYAYTHVSSNSGATFAPFSFAQVASFGGPLSDAPTPPLAVVVASDSPWAFACAPPPAPLPFPHALLASRGYCSFATKLRAAAASGASLLLVFDGLPGKYWASPSPPAAGACDVDASGFCFPVPAAELTLAEALRGWPATCGSACASGVCALRPIADAPPAADGSRSACCVPNDYLIMGGGGGAAVPPSLPALWLSAGPGTQLRALAAAALPDAHVLLTAGLRAIPQWDASGALMWALGVGAAGFASWGGGAGERRAWLEARGWGRGGGGGSGAPHSPSPLESLALTTEALHLTPRQALGLLASASAMLLGLFLALSLGLPIVWLVMGVFCLGAGGAFAALVAAPLVQRCAPPSLLRAPGCALPLPRALAAALGAPQALPLKPAPLATAALTIAAVGAWFALRHAPGAWAGQDLLGACLCALAVAQLRLASLRSASLLLWALFAYDVFMVFLTPFLFRGHSVMVDVATAGAPLPAPPGLPTPACYCRLHPGDAAVCGPGEMMPILFALPRLGDWRGGFSMLGLGDVVVPAVALAVLLRWDYAGGGGGGGGREGGGGGGEGGGGEEAVGLLGAAEGGGEEDGGALLEGPSACPRRRNGSANAPASAPSAGSLNSGGGGVALEVGAAAAGAPPLAPPRERGVLPAALRPALPLPWHKSGGAPLWLWGMGGYAVGLLLAQVAVATTGLGQPALLYLVPCVLLPAMGVARARGELGALWVGVGGEGAAAPGGGGNIGRGGCFERIWDSTASLRKSAARVTAYRTVRECVGVVLSGFGIQRPSRVGRGPCN